ncbi:MAG: SNF2-related protein [Bacteroidota bacterium]|nr:SNF2-related protein [Bacteroidota bacterium]
MNKKYINDYINFHADKKVIKRGNDLFHNNAIISANIDTNKDIADFEIQGGLLYTIKIEGFTSNNIQTSCNCPYNWNTLCKHRVAALLHIAENDNFTLKQYTEQKFPKRKNGFEPISIPNYKLLTIDLIHLQIDYNNLPSYDIEGKIIDTLFNSQNSISFHFSPHYSGDQQWVTFEHNNGEVKVISDEPNIIYGYSDSEAGVIYYLLANNMSNFFNNYFHKELFSTKEHLMHKYSIQETEKFEEYIRLFFHENLLKYQLYRKGIGLLTPNSDSYDHKLIHEISQTFDTLPQYQKKEIREIGFVVIPHNINNYNDKSFYITPIKGKSNKQGTKLISHIDSYNTLNYNETIYLSDNQKKLIDLIDYYNDTRQDNLYYNEDENYDDNNQHKINNHSALRTKLAAIQHIFELLEKERHIFTQKNNRDIFKIKKKNLIPVNIEQNPINLLLKVTKKDPLLILKSYFQISDEKIRTNTVKSGFYTSIIKDTIYVHKNINACYFLTKYPHGLRIHEKHKEIFYNEIVQKLSKQFKIEFTKTLINKEEHYPNPESRQLYITENENVLKFEPVVNYSNGQSYKLSQNGNTLHFNDNKAVEYNRDTTFENEFLIILSKLHPDFEVQKHLGFFHLSFDDLTKDMWFYKFYEELQVENIKVFGINKLKNFRHSPFKASVKTTFSSKQDWFELDIQINFGNYQIKINDLKKAVINKQQFIELKNGTIGLLPEQWIEKLSKYFRNGQVEKNKLHISKLRFNMIEELFDNINDEEILKEITEKKQRLKEIKEIEKVKIPRGIKANLRHYQKEGLQWLAFLDSMRWGGILADDMGLGKTLQLLTFFKLKQKKQTPPSLIVVPTTLLFNWENEIAKFAPSLKAHYHYGNKREKSTEKFSNFDLIITSYGVVVRDIELLKDFKFNYIVLDESQAVKNPASQRYKAVSLLQGSTKFALTGTPIENSTFDLYAQMNFINPGFFGDIKSFRDNYSTKIDRDGDQDISKELQRITNPFILRRTKEQVATELPAKTQNVIYCEMQSEQKDIYDAYRNEYRDKILQKIETNGLGKSKLFILEGLLRLRQICDSPLLLNKESITTSKSAKINELLRFITEKTANHKILIFSQFVGMLKLIKTELEKHYIDHEYLDGKCSKKQRQESVENFQSNTSLRVFLISLKAGGTGLNLTAADYVFIVDPWWNPAVEEQAIDRCYRIGQDKKVFAYRMITKNTVEEKILKLQEKKKKLASDIIQTDENLMKTLKPDDIKELFS